MSTHIFRIVVPWNTSVKSYQCEKLISEYILKIGTGKEYYLLSQEMLPPRVQELSVDDKTAQKATKNAEVKSRNIIKKFQEELNDIIKNDPVIYLNTAQKPIYYVQTTFEPELILDKVVDAENEERAIKSVIETRYESRSLIEVDAKQIRKGFLFLHPKYHVHLKYPARVGGQVRMPGVYKLEIGTELREWYTSKCSELNVGNYISMSLRGTARFRTEEYNFEQIIEKLIEMHKINIGDATRPIESAYINFSKTAFRARLSYYYAYQVIRISTNRYQLMEEWDDGDGY